MVIVKYNSSLVEQWRYFIYGQGGSQDAGKAITVDATGNIYVAGRVVNKGTGTGSDFGLSTIAFDKNGTFNNILTTGTNIKKKPIKAKNENHSLYIHDWLAFPIFIISEYSENDSS